MKKRLVAAQRQISNSQSGLTDFFLGLDNPSNADGRSMYRARMDVKCKDHGSK